MGHDVKILYVLSMTILHQLSTLLGLMRFAVLLGLCKNINIYIYIQFLKTCHIHTAKRK